MTPAALERSDVLIVGGGAAGLSVALGLAGRRVTLVNKGAARSGGSTPMAQGGIAAAVAPGDTPALHASDTLAAADGLAVAAAVDVLTAEGPLAIERLIALETRFDRDAAGRLALGREAAHGRARILHANGDATGAELHRALHRAVDRLDLEILSRTRVVELLQVDGRVVGAVLEDGTGRRWSHLAPAVVLATGGCGRLFARTTNPVEATGDGLALAAGAGALVVDLEFVQFHPTALAVGADPMPLVSEALRGAGALLVDGDGRRFMPAVHPAAELAPRDVVARAVFGRLERGQECFLDAREISGGVAQRFPTVTGLCRRHDVDPVRDLIPISPAVHYQMGGVRVDLSGRSSVAGLWACGEVASTGAHGANRLASNSLLEALVFGARVARDVRAAAPTSWSPLPVPLPVPAAPAEGEEEVGARLRDLMWRCVGVEREGAGLARAAEALAELTPRLPAGSPRAHQVTAARLITAAALARRESRGAHLRRDHPGRDEEWRRRLLWRLSDAGAPVSAGSEALEAPRAVAEVGR